MKLGEMTIPIPIGNNDILKPPLCDCGNESSYPIQINQNVEFLCLDCFYAWLKVRVV